MNSLFEAAIEIQNFLKSKKWRFCFIGGLAVLRWGESRITQDVDLSLLTGFGHEEHYIKELLATFKSRISKPLDFAIRNRILLIETSKSIDIDIALAGLPFENKMMERSSEYLYQPDCSLLTCSAEDLIVLKSFANRTKDWLDVEGILIRQSNKLDTKYILEELIPLCEIKEAPEIIDKLQQLMKQNIN